MALWKKILIAMVSIIFFVSLLVGITAFDLTGNVIRNFEREIVELTAGNTASQLQQVFTDARTTLARMVEDTGAHAIAEYQSLEDEQRQNYSVLLESRVKNFLSVSKLTGGDTFHFINMYMENGVEAVTSGADVLPYSDFESVCDYLDRERILPRDAYRSLVWYDVVQLRDVSGQETRCLLCVRFLYDRVTMERIGAIVAGVETDKLWQMYKAVFPEGMIVTVWDDVVVGGKTLLAHEPVPESLSQALAGAVYLRKNITYTTNGQPQQALFWKIANSCAYFVVPLRDTDMLESSQVARFFGQIAIVVAAAILVTSLIAVFFSRGVTNGLTKLKNTAQRVADGERSARFVPRKHDEVAYVGLQFNHMLDQLQKYYTDMQQYEKEKTDLELSLLHAKINPHLLYNTLDIVVWAIKNDDRQRAEQIVYALSDFFKRSLAKGREYTTLEEEVELTKSYLDLQCLVGAKDYRLQVYLDPRLADLKVLHLLFQPIVENSVAHGFQAFRDDGTIRISAHLTEGSAVELHIRDDGMGIAPEQVERINRLLNEDLSQENTKHYGLRNVARRIKTYYGRAFGMEITSEMGEFTDVTIRIPYRREKTGEEHVQADDRR